MCSSWTGRAASSPTPPHERGSEGPAVARALILGGTREARALAGLCAQAGLAAEVSLAGRVPDAAAYPLPTREGGFGGASGLAAYLCEGHFTALLDATHPFAAAMPWHGAEAARTTGVPFAMLKRPPWRPGPGDLWTPVPDLPTALARLPRGATAFLAVGASAARWLPLRPDCRLVLRSMTPPAALPDHATSVIGGPGDRAAETALLRAHGITHLVSKNAGGPAAEKLHAARDLDLPVLMIGRPALPAGTRLDSAEAALAWLTARA